MSMHISPEGISLLKGCESYRSHPYLDGPGNPTVGYGSRHLLDGSAVTMQTPPITEEMACQLLAHSLAGIEAHISSKVTVPLNQNQFDALVILAYNIGEGNFDTSTLLRKINAGDYRGAADQFLAWDKDHENGVLVVSDGLLNRRKAERVLFLSVA